MLYCPPHCGLLPFLQTTSNFSEGAFISLVYLSDSKFLGWSTLEMLWTRTHIVLRSSFGLLPPRRFVSFILLIFCRLRPHLASPSWVAIVQPPLQSPPASSSFFDMMDDGVPRACPDCSRLNPHTPRDNVDEDPTTGPTGWGGGEHAIPKEDG
jgi:hypothetical protein